MTDQTAAMTSPPNKLGKYEIRKMLGKGSMGIVFLAHDPVLERDVAIKVMAHSLIKDERKKQRFEREAKAVARLHHPNIVTIHDLGYDHQESPFIAMELLEGTDLEALVESDPPTLTRRLEIIAQVCRGLHHAHESGIVHRDIKPANIFVTKDGAKIMDFGVARWMQSNQTRSGVVHGTVNYMSPEQIRGEKVDGRSDIYSVGIVLFQLLTGEKIFDGDSIETVFFKTLSDDPPELVIPDGLELHDLQKIVSSALAKEPEERFSNAENMANAIETFLKHHSGSLPETPVIGSVATNSTPQPAAGRRNLRTLRDRPNKTNSTDANRGSTRPTTPLGRLRSIAAALILLGAAVGTYLFVFHQPESSQPTAAALEPPPTPVDLEQRFELAEGLLESGQIVQAFEAVQNILSLEPANLRALELEVAVRSAAENNAKSDPPPPVPLVEQPRPVVAFAPTPREQAATLTADAAMAIASGEIERARSFIEQGKGLDPENPLWNKLDDQLQVKHDEAERKSLAANYIQEGRRSLEEGNYQGAINAYKKAMEYDPQSLSARNGLEQATSLELQVEASKQAAMAPTRQFVESKTVFTRNETDEGEVVGFEMEERFKVNDTAEPFFPAQIVIEINPTDAKPGEPFVLRVRVFNDGYRPIEVQSLELVSRFADKTTGKGAQIPTRTRRIDPQATVLLHEITGTWREAQQQGEIKATVTLANGDSFSKSISW